MWKIPHLGGGCPDRTVRTELHRHPTVATLSTYIHWKMEDDHTYHNRQVHDNTIHHMVLTTYFSMHVRNLSKVLYLLCLWCLLTIVSSNSHTGLVWRFYSCVATAGCRCSSVRTVSAYIFTEPSGYLWKKLPYCTSSNIRFQINSSHQNQIRKNIYFCTSSK